MLILSKIKGYIMSMLEGTGRLLCCLTRFWPCSISDRRWIAFYIIIILFIVLIIIDNKYNQRENKLESGDEIEVINSKDIAEDNEDGLDIAEGNEGELDIDEDINDVEVEVEKDSKVGLKENTKENHTEDLKEVSMEGSKESNVADDKDGNKESNSDKEKNKENNKEYGKESNDKQLTNTK